MSFANNSFNLKPSIKAFGVEFNRLSRKDLPILGKWRNDPLILPHMDSDRIISADVMNVWFNKIKNSPKYCAYLASKNREHFGYVEIKNINEKLQCCETGFFLFGESYIGTGFGLYLVLFSEILMSQLKLDIHIAKIHKNNIKAISVSKSYGLTVSHFQDEFIFYKTPKEMRLRKLRIIAKRLGILNEFESLLVQN